MCVKLPYSVTLRYDGELIHFPFHSISDANFYFAWMVKQCLDKQAFPSAVYLLNGDYILKQYVNNIRSRYHERLTK